MANKTTTIFRKVENMEKDLQKLKVEVFFSLPKKQRKAIYPEKSILESVRDVRKAIWNQRYAKKI